MRAVNGEAVRRFGRTRCRGAAQALNESRPDSYPTREGGPLVINPWQNWLSKTAPSTPAAASAPPAKRRRSRLQHQHDRLSGSPDRSVLQGPDRHHDLSAHRQLRHQRRGPRIAAAAGRGLHRPRTARACRAISARIKQPRRLPGRARHHRPGRHRHAGPGSPAARARRHERRAVDDRSRRRSLVHKARDLPGIVGRDLVREVDAGEGVRLDARASPARSPRRTCSPSRRRTTSSPSTSA